MTDAAANVPKDTIIGGITGEGLGHLHSKVAPGAGHSTLPLTGRDLCRYSGPGGYRLQELCASGLAPLIDFRHMSDIFGGTDTVELLVQADDITDPDILQWMDEFCIYLKNSRDQIFGYESIAAFVKQANGGEYAPGSNRDQKSDRRTSCRRAGQISGWSQYSSDRPECGPGHQQPGRRGHRPAHQRDRQRHRMASTTTRCVRPGDRRLCCNDHRHQRSDPRTERR